MRLSRLIRCHRQACRTPQCWRFRLASRLLKMCLFWSPLRPRLLQTMFHRFRISSKKVFAEVVELVDTLP